MVPSEQCSVFAGQVDEYDTKGKRFLVTQRRTPDFDHFVDEVRSSSTLHLITNVSNEVNDKLAPPGVALRKIYTAAGGSEVRPALHFTALHSLQVRSVSALTVSKEYTASPKKFDPNFQSRNNSRHSWYWARMPEETYLPLRVNCRLGTVQTVWPGTRARKAQQTAAKVLGTAHYCTTDN